MATKSPRQQKSKFIAAGCIIIDEACSNVPHALWALPDLKQWHVLDAVVDVDEAIEAPDRLLPVEITKSLLSAKPLVPCKPLLQARWIRLTFSISIDSPTQGLVRVYILPDDVDNISVPRSDTRLQKLRLKLFSALDFSPSTWHGEVGSRASSPAPFEDSEEPTYHDNGQSLLDMFNSIPSPDPDPDMIQDWCVRGSMETLLIPNVTSIVTPLYPYQQRSAALMLQREYELEEVVDPRLVKVVDQEGNPWYYDAIGGVALREPTFYERPCGGILAEQMGCGKTLICLALIAATAHLPSETPAFAQSAEPIVRDRVGSLATMAAATITANSVPWRAWFLPGLPLENANCISIIQDNPGFYHLSPPEPRRTSRLPQVSDQPAIKIYHSHATLVIVPPNLIRHWREEIAKHTPSMSVLVYCTQLSPALESLLEYHLVLVSSTKFDHFVKSAAARIHWKRCIVDEGHTLGNSTTGNRSDLLLAIDSLQVTARWVVTGTPSKGLYGVDQVVAPSLDSMKTSRTKPIDLDELEKGDLRRIGSIASLFLKMRPWANSSSELGVDKPADWAAYVMPSKSSPRGRRDCLWNTLQSTIIRHRLPEVVELLPSVEEKVVYINPSYQDTMMLNLFSAMVIFNSVQSQRTDRDYLFHPHQRKFLMELVSNLRQSSFFGGSFWSPSEIMKSVETATQFLAERKVQISDEDATLLKEAIQFSQNTVENDIKKCANLFREVPIYLEHFPWAAGESWSLDSKGGEKVLTDAPLVLELQRFLRPMVEAPVSLQMLLKSGKFEEHGKEAKERAIGAETAPTTTGTSAMRNRGLAGRTTLGEDNSSPRRRRTATLEISARMERALTLAEVDVDVAAPLASTQLVSTASAKLSYLIDQILKHQQDEQIIIFYENDNTAYYLAVVLEMLQVHHLIYAKGITPDRRAQYVNTFNNNPKFRVLLMDITQGAFGLNMWAASRIYFINPVLNPQIQKQAIGRARRLSQKKPVTVETLVLRGSIEEVIVQRWDEMSQAELWKTHSVLDDKPIYEWIRNAKILPLPGGGSGAEPSGPEQMARLQAPPLIFTRGFGRETHPDQDLVVEGISVEKEAQAFSQGVARPVGLADSAGLKRSEPATPRSDEACEAPPLKAKKPRVKFAGVDDEDP